MQHQQALEEEVLLSEPWMPLVLIGMHRTAEDEDGAVGIKGLRKRRFPGEAPLVESVPAFPNDVAEGAGPDLLAMDDREDVDAATLR